MIKILTIIGARPQFIKAAAVSRTFMEYPQIHEVLVHTGQHFDPNMSDIFFSQMGLPKPDYQLDINSLSHGAMTGRMLEEIERVILKEQPDYVMVYGDTNSTLAGALAAVKLHVQLIHIEAGLRSFNMTMPEEINRILTDRVSNILFCPTEAAVENLLNEGFSNLDVVIYQSGDVMQDAALMFSEVAKELDPLGTLPVENGSYILCTLHRAENTDDPEKLSSIVEGLNELHKIHPVILPLHPRTRNKIKQASLKLDVHILEPTGYLEMVQLLKHAGMVVTDSGGLQKEAYFFNKYCVTIRDQTEWIELVQGGFNFLVGSDGQKMQENVISNWERPFLKGTDLYGGGNASREIVQQIIARSGF